MTGEMRAERSVPAMLTAPAAQAIHTAQTVRAVTEAIPAAGTAEAEGSMSFVHWIVIMALPYIPIIGSIAYLALLLIWAFGHTASKTRKSWARATLVITVAAMLMMSYMLQSVLGSGGFAELMNSMLGAGV